VRLITWNIQWCRGMDGRVDPVRIAHEARKLCDPDICCFQEVASNYATLAGSSGEDQFSVLEELFPGYSAHPVITVDVNDGVTGRRQFGNVILSRLPVQQVFRHSLPWPPEAGVPNMARAAIEAVIEAPWGLVSVVTTHLEFYSAGQRAAQVAELCRLDAERRLHAQTAPAKTYKAGPFRPFARPAHSLLTGDFNMRPEDPQVARLLEVYADAWKIGNPGKPHPPTFGVYDNEFASEPYCCDFVFISPELQKRVAATRIEAATKASDHQPVIVEFED
jgi:endonuclease/exonuclease/phosphatase family metal-dependent hydrolase